MVTLPIRSIWYFLAGVALAFTSVWVFSSIRAEAVNPAESSIITVTPQRILDSRDPNNLGLPGPFFSRVPQKLKVTGSIPTANGPKTVVPIGARGVVLNVTPVGATRSGFISVEPGNAVGLPTTSSLNFTAHEINPNTVIVDLPPSGPDSGRIRLTYDAYGQVGPSTDILVDVVGYTTNDAISDLATRVRQLETFGNVIPAGTTVTGNFVFDSALIADGADHYVHVPLPAKAPVGLTADRVNFASDSNSGTIDDDPTCSGSLGAPTAPPGKVCIYLKQLGGLHLASGESTSLYTLLTDAGFMITWRAKGAAGIDMFLHATWAYTAP